MNKQIHSLLKRQLKRHFGDTDGIPEEWKNFIDAVNDAYLEFDEDRSMLERSLELSSQELMQRNSELQALITAFPDLFIWFDSNGIILDCKEGSTTNLFIPAEKMIGKPIQKIPFQDVGEKFLEAISQVKNTNSIVSMEYSLTIKGSENHYEARMLPLLEEQFLCIVRNITERKQAEQALMESEKKYKELYEESKKAEEVYRSLIHSSADAIVIYDLEGKVKYLSPAFTKIFGWSIEELEGKKIPFIPDSEVEDTETVVNNVILHGKPCQGFMTKRFTKDGRLLDISYSASRFDDHEGKPSGTLFVLRDITERKKLEARFRKAEKMEAIGMLAGGVAHDLNNILSGIVSYPELLLMKLPKDSPMRKGIQIMQTSGHKAAAIVQDLLTMARRGVATSEVVNLNDIIADYMESPEYDKLLFHHTNVTVKTDLQSNLANTLGSPIHISKTIMNLVSNAAEAMQNGGELTIATENRYIDKPFIGYEKINEGDYVTLRVSDTGTGISSETLERIFEPFYTKKVMGRSGTGLGMAVIWGTVKDHDGFIDVKSILDIGTTFTLYFPLTHMEIEKTKEKTTIDDYLGNGETILIVDDVEEQLDIASNILTQLGYTVSIAESGEKAVEYMKTRKVDLLILDMIMDPGMDGLETYKQILEIHPKQPALITSGFSESERVKEAQKLGAGQYIKKPYMLETIGLAVRNILKKNR
jgi:two-component system, cell cycle sensor histidine kinase and response regulator CckA